MAYESIASHRAMALDAVRNEAYAAALRRVIGPDSVVLDLGAGTGVLGMIAARLGAKRVYLVEPSDIISVAQEIVAANGLQDVVQCLHGRIEDVTVPEKVDVIVSVMTGNFLLTEDLIPVLFHARDSLLKPGGHLVPDRASMEAVLVSAPDVHATHVEGWSTPQHGVDLSAGRTYAANSLLYGPTNFRECTYLAEPATLMTLDFTRDAYDALHAQATFEVTASGVCHGLAGWFRMQLGDEWLSTSPRSPQMHWSSAYLPIDPPMTLEKGERVSLSLDRVPRGDWSWRLRASKESRRHSTMLSAPLVPAMLAKASQQYVPPRTDALAAAAHVLACVDGAQDVTAIAASLRARFPDRYRTTEDALEFTQRIVSGF